MGETKLVCFDLDGTLIKEIHSVMFLCILNGNLAPLREIEALESSGSLDWIEADHRKALLLEGLRESKIREEFHRILKPLKNIGHVVEILRSHGIRSVLISAGPRQVARVAEEMWGFDSSEGSDYETLKGFFTGKILEHVGETGKNAILRSYCEMHGIRRNECVAVGDGVSDIALFDYCGESIAINYSPVLSGKASRYLRTDDLNDILGLLGIGFDLAFGLKEIPLYGKTKFREAVRGIVLRQEMVLMIKTNKGDYKFPGGGLQENETHRDCLKREMREETGYELTGSIVFCGVTTERKTDDCDPHAFFVMKSYYYFCCVQDEAGGQDLDDYEQELDFTAEFIVPDQAYKINCAIKDSLDPNASIWVAREAAVLKEILTEN